MTKRSVQEYTWEGKDYVGMWTKLGAEMSTFPLQSAEICSDFSPCIMKNMSWLHFN